MTAPAGFGSSSLTAHRTAPRTCLASPLAGPLLPPYTPSSKSPHLYVVLSALTALGSSTSHHPLPPALPPPLPPPLLAPDAALPKQALTYMCR